MGSASQEALAQYDAAYLGDTSQPVLYLTFDAGYENGCTAQILDILKKHQAPAAFFLVGNYIQRNPELVKRMAEEGHIVGNHTAHHYDMSKIGDKATFAQELGEVEDLYRDVTGQELPHYYRPPQGIYSQENLAMARSWAIRPYFGPWRMWTGTMTASPPGKKPLPSSCPGFTTEPWCSYTAPPKPTPPSWMSCSPNGRRWGTGSTA